MTPTIVALIQVTSWALGAFIAWRLCVWCGRFVKTTTIGRTRGWTVAVGIVAPFAVVFGAAIVICLLMVVRYAWHLAVIVWPSLAAYLAPF